MGWTMNVGGHISGDLALPDLQQPINCSLGSLDS
jgi:hypothetical protein